MRQFGLGVTLTIVCQSAKLVEDAIFDFASPDETTQVENEWAVYQVRSTCNFSPNSPLVSWLAGGLNYQVEHHLFPRISHIHYPALSRIVKEKCQLFDISYNCNSTLGKAIHSHFRLLRAMGNKPFSVAVA